MNKLWILVFQSQVRKLWGNGMKYFSMFSGIGGFELGIKRAYNKQLAKIEQDREGRNRDSDEQELLLCSSENSPLCIGYSEIDKYSIQTYEKNFRGTKNYGDATKINPEELPDFDMLCGGFPCQAFSIAGRRKGFEDTRGTLFFDIARILKVKRPKIVFLENVKGLLNHNKGETFRVILQTLDELGYEVQWMVLNSKFFGVPQNRERVFIIGSVRGTSRPEILPFPETINSFDGKNERIMMDVYNKKFRDECPTLTEPHHNSIRVLAGTWRTHKDGQGFRENKEGVSPCIPARAREDGSGQPVIKRIVEELKEEGLEPTEKGWDSLNKSFPQIRRLTPTECERLQGYPDGWTKGVSDTQRYKQLGNSVTVNVIEAIASSLLRR
jgi:DNA (cytosine-5)-methyltransferase 1